MKRTVVGVDVNVVYYGEKSLSFHFGSVEDALPMINTSLKEGYKVTISNDVKFEEEEAV